MKLEGWLFLLFGWGVIASATVWCFWKLLNMPSFEETEETDSVGRKSEIPDKSGHSISRCRNH